MPFLLFRAGFEIDAVTAGTFVNYGKLISRHIAIVDEKDLLKKLDEIDLDAYDLIVPFDDKFSIAAFWHSWFGKVVSKFGPSSLRTYEKLGNSCDEKLFLTSAIVADLRARLESFLLI